MKSAIGMVSADGEDAPRGLGQRVDHDQREHRQDDDHDREDGDQGGDAADDADLLADHLAEALPVAAHREEHDGQVLHRAGEDDADDDPDGARQVAHLGGEHRADERAGAGDGGEVVAEEHPAVGDVEVDAVLQPLGRGGPLVVGPQHLVGDEPRVEAVGDRVRAQRGEQQPQRRDRLAAGDGQHAPADRADRRPPPTQISTDFSDRPPVVWPDGLLPPASSLVIVPAMSAPSHSCRRPVDACRFGA